jgi:hypothetical protein
VDYVSERILWHNLRPSRATRGKYRILDGKGESGLFFYIQSSEGGSPCLCRLRTVSVEPCRISIDYVLMHTRFMEPCKFTSFDDH